VNIPPGSDGIGDYIGLSAGPGVMWGSWVDTRNGNQDIYAARELFTPQPTPTTTSTVTPGSNTPTRTPAPLSTATATATATVTVSASATVTATTTATTCPVQFTDVPPGSPFYPFVRCLACRCIVSGYSDGTFHPNNNVTRGQAAKIVSNAAGFQDPPGAQIFEDVSPGSTFYDFVQRLAARGVINGYSCGGSGEPCVPPGSRPYFRSNSDITRGQLAKVVSNTAGYQGPAGSQIFEDVALGSTFYDFVQYLASRNILSGYPCGGAGEPCVPPANRPYFRPANRATRGQAAKIVSNTFFPECSP
jgi:hypothetical protein